jgi:thiamine biosynthesis lipoprotein
MKKLVLFLTFCFVLSGCSRNAEMKKSGFYLERVYETSISYNKKDKDIKKKAAKTLNNAFSSLMELDSNLNKLSPISELSAINTNAPLRMVTISPLTYQLIKKSVEGSILTDGYFDITWSPLIDLFNSNTFPSYENIEKVKNRIGYLNIQLDRSLDRLRFSSAYTKIDPDTIKTGYAVDLLAKSFENAGFVKGYVKTKGVVYYLGSKKEVFKFEDGSEMKVKLSKSAAVTIKSSDDYYKKAKVWKKYLPLEISEEEIISVTVFAPNAFTGEVLANAFYFMGTEKSLEKINLLKSKVTDPDLYNVVFVIEDNGVKKLISTFNNK